MKFSLSFYSLLFGELQKGSIFAAALTETPTSIEVKAKGSLNGWLKGRCKMFLFIFKNVWKFKKSLYLCSRFKRKAARKDKTEEAEKKIKNVSKTFGSSKKAFTFVPALNEKRQEKTKLKRLEKR